MNRIIEARNRGARLVPANVLAAHGLVYVMHVLHSIEIAMKGASTRPEDSHAST